MNKKLYLISQLFITSFAFAYQPLYFCTASDAKFFDILKSFIGSVHKTNFDHLGEIAVFDLGLGQEQIDEINSMQKVHVYEVERTHPDILKPVKIYSGNKIVPGCYAWKPVAIKQALDMFPYVLWQDAGNVVLKPLDELFEHIRQHGYFLMGSGTDWKNTIGNHITQRLIKKFHLDKTDKKWLLNTLDVSSCTIGIARNHRVYYDLIVPVYELTRDVDNFLDDGTYPKGFGGWRLEQIVFSIFARLLELKDQRASHRPTRMFLTIANKKIPFYMDHNTKML